MNRSEILAWLKEEDTKRLQTLWNRADEVRREAVGDEVHLRGLIEISNHCVRNCRYCGLRSGNRELLRYRMSDEEVMECVEDAVAYGYGTVVIQAGEDVLLSGDRITKLVRRIKTEWSPAITLSLGERSHGDLQAWRDAGADRYLLRFETSDRRLYDAIHPPAGRRPSNRMAILRDLARMGYEVGSGVMVGIPGQSFESLADDIATFAELELDMIGVDPFVANPATPLGARATKRSRDGQVPNTELMTDKVIALSRLLCPWANISSSTAITLESQELELARGANVLIADLTPRDYRELYEIYPSKGCSGDSTAACGRCIRAHIESIGREPGTGPGASMRKARQQPQNR